MENEITWVACRWCQDKLYFDSKSGWYQCYCGAIALDMKSTYYRLLANFEDFELGGK